MGVSPSWSVFCVDSGIAFTPTIGVAGDLRIRIDPADVRVVDAGIAWAPGDLTDQQGEPRATVRALAARRGPNGPRADRGLTALVGAELECTMLRPTRARPPPNRGRPTASARRWTARRSWSTSPPPPSGPGCSVEQIHTEYGHDQLEVSLAPTTPVAAADAVILDPHRPRPGRGPARIANLLLAGAIRGRGGQRRAPAPVADRRSRPAVLRR